MTKWIDIVLTTNYVKVGIPFFLLLVIAEAIFSYIKGQKRYRLNDTINSLTCGIYNQIAGVLFASAVFVLTYGSIQKHFGIFDFYTLSVGYKVFHAILLFTAVDLAYYWFHRSSHRINIMWGAHIVHHQSEEYNLSTALRQSMFQNCFSWVFYTPLAVLGYPLSWFLAMLSLNNLYQFWIHTKSIKKMHPLMELIFNTPSHHRVHHGRNDQYLDKNHAGTLIIWDRMFGTFCEETSEPNYGITTGLNSWNPLWAQFHYFWHLTKIAINSPFWSDKFKIWYKPPDWVAKCDRVQTSTPNSGIFPFYNPYMPLGTKVVSSLLFLLTIICGMILAFYKFSYSQKLLLSSLTIIISCGAGYLMSADRKRQHKPLNKPV